MSDGLNDEGGGAPETQPELFYPAVIPREEGHPTFAQFRIVGTGDERGKGLRGNVGFRQGQCVARISGVLVRCSGINTIQMSPQLHVYDPWFCRFLLHSCDPNLVVDVGAMAVRATRDIASGEYLTIDYAATEDVIANQFACHCGAAGCRGWMMGRREGPNAAGRALLEARKGGQR